MLQKLSRSGVKKINQHAACARNELFRSLSSAVAETAAPKKSKVLTDYLRELPKARLSSGVVFTSAIGYIVAGGPIDFATMAAVCGGTTLCAASAGTFNQALEKDRDARMARTAARPLPSGRVSVPAAVAYGFTTGSLGVLALYTLTNPIVAALGAANIFLYSIPYTLSKPVTEWNTDIGAVVGAIPPAMGWAAATGSLLAWEPLALGAFMYLWQFPHFYALAWKFKEDYARGGYQMVPVNDPTGTRTANLIWNYSLALTAFPILTSIGGVTSYMFAVEGVVLNSGLLYLAHKFKSERSKANAYKTFKYSLVYLLALLPLFAYHNRNWNEKTIEDTEINEVNTVLTIVRDKLKEHCPHEHLVETGHACPKIITDKVVDSAEGGAREIAGVTVSATKSAVERQQ